MESNQCNHPAHQLKLIDITIDRDVFTKEEEYLSISYGGAFTYYVEVKCTVCGETFALTRIE